MNHISTIKEYLAKEYIENGGRLDLKADADFLTDVLYEGLELEDRPSDKDQSREEYELIAEKMLDVLEILAGDVENMVNEMGEE